MNLAFGTRLRDNKSGFILCRRDVMTNLLRHRSGYRYFQSFIGVTAAAQGYTIAEVDTDFDVRAAGESFLSRLPVGVSLRIVWELLNFRLETWLAARRSRTQRQRRWAVPYAITDPAQGGT